MTLRSDGVDDLAGLADEITRARQTWVALHDVMADGLLAAAWVTFSVKTCSTVSAPALRAGPVTPRPEPVLPGSTGTRNTVGA